MTAPTYRVAHLDGNGDVDCWLTERLAVTHVAWEAATFTARDAGAFARWAGKHIRPLPGEGRWVVQKAVDRGPALAHYTGLAEEAKAGAELGGVA